MPLVDNELSDLRRSCHLDKPERRVRLHQSTVIEQIQKGFSWTR